MGMGLAGVVGKAGGSQGVTVPRANAWVHKGGHGQDHPCCRDLSQEEALIVPGSWHCPNRGASTGVRGGSLFQRSVEK